MPAYLIPISGALKPITLRWNTHVCGRSKAVPHELVVKEYERSLTDNSDYPLGSLSLMSKGDFAEYELRLPYRHETKLATGLANSPSGFYVLQYIGGFNTFINEHGEIDILVNGRSLRKLTNEAYDGLILTDGDEITFTEGSVGNQEFHAESYRFSLKDSK